MAVDEIVIGIEKIMHTMKRAEKDELCPIKIPLTGKLEDMPDEIKKGYYGQDILSKVTPECGYKRVHEEHFKRLDSEDWLHATCFNYPLNNKECRYSNLTLMWIKERKEWIAIAHSYNEGVNGKDKKPVGESYSGPFSLDDYCANGVRESFGIKKGAIDIDKISKKNPQELRNMSRRN